MYMRRGVIGQARARQWWPRWHDRVLPRPHVEAVELLEADVRDMAFGGLLAAGLSEIGGRVTNSKQETLALLTTQCSTAEGFTSPLYARASREPTRVASGLTRSAH